MQDKDLGRLLVRSGLVSRLRLAWTNWSRYAGDGGLSRGLIELELVSASQIAEALSVHYGVPGYFPGFEVDRLACDLVPEKLAREHLAVPVLQVDETLVVAMASPNDAQARAAISSVTGLPFEVVVCSAAAILDTIEEHWDNVIRDTQFGDTVVPELENHPAESDLGSVPGVVRLANLILRLAVEKGSSEIFIGTFDGAYQVRFRVGAMTHLEMSPPWKLQRVLADSFKEMAGLDVENREQCLAAEFCHKIGSDENVGIFRIRTWPTPHGESILIERFTQLNLLE